MWCDPRPEYSRPLFTLIGAVGFLVLLIGPIVLLVRGQGVRGPLAITWAAASVVTPFAYANVDLVLHRPAGGWLWLPVAVVAGIGIGLLVSQVEHGRRRATFAAMGALGGAGWVTLLLSLVLAVTAATGTCLD